MVWAGISATAKTDLVFIDGNLNGQRYINEVLTHHVLPFLRQMPVPDPIFQDDNARPHRARIVNDFIHRNNVNRMACQLLGIAGTCPVKSVLSLKVKPLHYRDIPPTHHCANITLLILVF